MSTDIIAITMPMLDSIPAHTCDERIERAANWLDQHESIITLSAKLGSSRAHDLQRVLLQMTFPPAPVQIEAIEQAIRDFEQVVC